MKGAPQARTPAGGPANAEDKANLDSADFSQTRQLVERMRDAVDKRVANARARLALAGFECHIVSGGFVVCRWGHARDIESLDELERFVEFACGGRR